MMSAGLLTFVEFYGSIGVYQEGKRIEGLNRAIQRFTGLRMKRKKKFQESRKSKRLLEIPAIAEPPCRDGGSSDGVLDIDVASEI